MEKCPGLQILLTIIFIATGVEILLVLVDSVFPEWVTITTAICIITIGAAFTFITTKCINGKKGVEEVDK